MLPSGGGFEAVATAELGEPDEVVDQTWHKYCLN